MVCWSRASKKKGFLEEVSLDEKGELGTISRRKGGSKYLIKVGTILRECIKMK